MEIRDPLHGPIFLNEFESAIFYSPYFQRLRRIKQCGFSEYSFPGSTHNRLSHSLGVLHLASRAFTLVAQQIPQLKNNTHQYQQIHQTIKLAALLHDIGHGPLSHTTEEAMPLASQLTHSKFGNYRSVIGANNSAVSNVTKDLDTPVKASHEDYTLQIILASELKAVIENNSLGILAVHVAALIFAQMPTPQPNIFKVDGVDLRPLLTALVSGELDVDRMDYLQRDSYYYGISYGKFDQEWLLRNLSTHQVNDQMYLALNDRALYSFDDFLIARYHMYLMAYFHDRTVVYDEMLLRYLSSPTATYRLPADINEYLKYDDYSLYNHLLTESDPMAQAIAHNRPYELIFEVHSEKKPAVLSTLIKEIKSKHWPFIEVSSKGQLSKYHSKKNPQLFVVSPQKGVPTRTIYEVSDLFTKYEKAKVIHRLYISPENAHAAKHILDQIT